MKKNSHRTAKHFLIWLFVANAVLISLHLGFHYAELNGEISPFVADLVRRFSMDAELSVPAWFASSLLLTIAALAGIIGCRTSKKNTYRKHWWVLSALFVYLSIDEASELHELLIYPTQNLLGIESGPLFFAWFIPVLAIVGILGLFMIKFFLQLPKTLKLQLTLAAVLFFGGAVGVEMISGAYWEANDFVYDMTYRVLNAFEEGLENAGSIVAIYGLLSHISKKEL